MNEAVSKENVIRIRSRKFHPRQWVDSFNSVLHTHRAIVLESHPRQWVDLSDAF